MFHSTCVIYLRTHVSYVIIRMEMARFVFTFLSTLHPLNVPRPKLRQISRFVLARTEIAV